MHPIEIISNRYPQVCFPIGWTVKCSEKYKNAVLRGKRDHLSPQGFSLSPKDELKSTLTPEGPVDILFLFVRTDFERCVQALAYRCEPRIVPPSIGAMTISGLINWEKIDHYRDKVLASGGINWTNGFNLFTSNPENFRDSLIIVSNGFYSAVPAERIGLSDEEWLSSSLIIRTQHELTHFFFRKRYPDDVDPVRDEVIADAYGLIKAFGDYDSSLAKLLLGIEKENYQKGGRLKNYLLNGMSLQDAINKAIGIIDKLPLFLVDISEDLLIEDYFKQIRSIF